MPEFDHPACECYIAVMRQASAKKLVPASDDAFEWRVAPKPVPYVKAIEEMERRIAAIEAGAEPELFWLLEHPPLYTAGTSATADELIDKNTLPVFETGRGGRYTYHGPGQRVIYALCDLRNRGRDVRAHVWRLEDWIIRTLGDFGIKGERREGRIGIWVEHKKGNPSPAKTKAYKECKPKFLHPLPQGERNYIVEEKIAAIGVRVRKWIAYHGLALNVNPDLSHYKGIVPCGLDNFGVTSMHALGVKATMAEVDAAFKRQVKNIMI